MKRVIHQAMTDLRAQRWLVASWAAMLAVACAIEALKLDVPLADHGASRTGFSSFGLLLSALAMGRVVLGWVLAVRIVHADPLDGTTAFWLTRPLSPRMLLAAKGGLLGVLLLVAPAVGALVVWLANGVAPAALPRVLAQWLLIEALPLLPVVLVATLTRDLARIVLTLIVGFAFWYGLQFSCRWWSMAPVELRNVPDWYWIVGRAWLVVGAGVVALSAALIARQYLTRRTPSVAFAALVAALGITAGAALWPVQLASEYAKADDLGDAQNASAGGEWRGSAGISVTIPEGSLRLLTRTFPNALFRLVGDLRVDGLGQDLVVDVVKGRATLRFPEEGDVFEERNVWAVPPYVGPWGIADDASRRNFQRAAGARLFDRGAPWGSGLLLIGLERGAYERHHASPAVYEGDVVLDAYRVVQTATMPLKEGASGSAGDVETTILDIRGEPARVVIEMREAAPRVALPGESKRFVRVVRNRKRGEALVLWGNTRRVAPSALGSTAVIARRTIAALGRPLSGQGVSLDAAWLEDAELVFVSLERLGRFTKRVTVPNLILPEVAVPKTEGEKR